MNYDEIEQLRELRDDVERILNLDTNFLLQKMKEDPDEILATMRAGFLVLDSILNQVLNKD